MNQGAFAEMRMLLLELRPNILAQTSLPDLMTQLANATTGRTRTQVTAKVDGSVRLPLDVHIALYLIAQEAVNNVVKHARASEAIIEMQCDENVVELQVIDNCQGFDPDEVTGQRMGLKLMCERVESIGDQCEIDSQMGAGTRIRVTWTGTPKIMQGTATNQDDQ